MQPKTHRLGAVSQPVSPPSRSRLAAVSQPVSQPPRRRLSRSPRRHVAASLAAVSPPVSPPSRRRSRNLSCGRVLLGTQKALLPFLFCVSLQLPTAARFEVALATTHLRTGPRGAGWLWASVGRCIRVSHLNNEDAAGPSRTSLWQGAKRKPRNAHGRRSCIRRPYATLRNRPRRHCFRSFVSGIAL